MLNPDFRDMLSCLNEEGVDFIVVGAYALAAHGLVRATGDIDGAPTSGLSAEDFTTPATVLQLGVEPSRIDLLTGIDGVDFDEAANGKVRVDVGGLEVFVLSKEHLLKNKLAAGRDKDRSDIAWLEKGLYDEA